MTRERERRTISNSNVVPGEGYVTHHRILLADCKWRAGGEKRPVRNRRLKLWELKGEQLQEFRENVYWRKNRLEREEVKELWTNMKNTSLGAADEEVGRTRGGGPG